MRQHSCALLDSWRVHGLFPPAEYQLPPFSMAIRGCLAVPGTVSFQGHIQTVDSLLRKPASSWFTPCVNNCSRISLVSLTHRSPSFTWPSPYLPFVIRPSNWPFSCLKAVPLHNLPFVCFFLCPEVCCFGFGVMRNISSGSVTPLVAEVYLTRPSCEVD